MHTTLHGISVLAPESNVAPGCAEAPLKQTHIKQRNNMIAIKRTIRSGGRIPLIAALPYSITAAAADNAPSFRSCSYDPVSQLTVFAGGRDYSTCREDESINPFFGKSRSDTKKDD